MNSDLVTHRQLDSPDGLFFNPLTIARPFIQELRDHHPDWFHDYEDAQINQASPSELMDLLRSAPTQFAAGVLFGKMMALQDTQIAQQIVANQAIDNYSQFTMHSIDARTNNTSFMPLNA